MTFGWSASSPSTCFPLAKCSMGPVTYTNSTDHVTKITSSNYTSKAEEIYGTSVVFEVWQNPQTELIAQESLITAGNAPAAGAKPDLDPDSILEVTMLSLCKTVDPM